jgi:hypothetical protein
METRASGRQTAGVFAVMSPSATGNRRPRPQRHPQSGCRSCAARLIRILHFTVSSREPRPCGASCGLSLLPSRSLFLSRRCVRPASACPLSCSSCRCEAAPLRLWAARAALPAVSRRRSSSPAGALLVTVSNESPFSVPVGIALDPDSATGGSRQQPPHPVLTACTACVPFLKR